MTSRRITLFAGHYGSGKTNLAINFARKLGRGTAIADLDIVNPYFRTKDSAAALSAEGIDLVVSEYANSNVDFPAMPREAYSLVADRSRKVVIDVGGDDRGALALGRYVDDIVAEGDYDMLAVVNFARPLTSSVGDAIAVLKEIEMASRLPFTGLVNNTNLGPQTTAAFVVDSQARMCEVAAEMHLPIAFTACERALESELRGRVDGLFPIDIQRLYYQLS